MYYIPALDREQKPDLFVVEPVEDLGVSRGGHRALDAYARSLRTSADRLTPEIFFV